MDDGVALADCVAGHAGQLGDLHEPLQAQARLDRLASALRVADGVDVRADLFDYAPLLRQSFAHLHAGFLAGQAVKLGAGVSDVAGLVHDDWHVQVVAQAHLVIVRVVGRGDLHCTGAQLPVDVVVGDDLQLQVVAERVIEFLADEVLVALVVRVDGDGDISQHRLDAGGGHDEVRLVVVERTVADGDELALDILVHDLDIGDGCLQHRGPVDQAVILVDHPGVEKLLENGDDRSVQPFVECEALPRPVDGIADRAHLRRDGAAVLLFPLPHARDEFLAAVVVAVLALGLLEHGLDLGLRGDARVVHARQPQHLVALHTLASHQGIHQRVVQRVAHVQLTRHIGRGQHDRVGGLVRRRVGREVALVHPLFEDPLLEVLRLPALRQGVRPTDTDELLVVRRARFSHG